MMNAYGGTLRWCALLGALALILVVASACQGARTPPPSLVLETADPLPVPTPRPAEPPPAPPPPPDYTHQTLTYASACSNLSDLLSVDTRTILGPGAAITWGQMLALTESTLTALSELSPPPTLYTYHSSLAGPIAAMRDRSLPEHADGVISEQFAAFTQAAMAAASPEQQASPGFAQGLAVNFMGPGVVQALVAQGEQLQSLPSETQGLLIEANCTIQFS